MSFGPSSHTQTSSVSMPDYVTDAQKAMYEGADNLFSSYFKDAKAPANPVAGMNSDHDTYANMIRSLVGGSGANFSAGAAAAGKAGYNAMPFATGVGYTGTDTPAAMVTGDHIAAMSNPFMDAVAEATNKRLNTQNDREAASIGSRAAARGAFSGSGSQESMERVGLSENMLDTAAETEANLRAGAYDRATDAAFRNSDIVNNAIGRSQTVAVNNTNSFNDALSRAVQTALSAGQLDLQGQSTADSLSSSALDRLIKTAGAVKGVGDVRQGNEQAQIDIPADMLAKYASFISGQVPTTTTSKQPVYNNGGDWMGGLTALAGMFL